MAIEASLVIPDALALSACAAAAVIDARRYRIPNWLTAGALAIGLGLNAALGGLDGLLWALAGGGIGLVAFGLLGGLGLLGMGDVKLMAAVGALIRWPLIGPALLYTALAGGVVAIAIALHRGPRAADRRIPYGLAILAGCAWAVASRYEPALGLL